MTPSCPECGSPTEQITESAVQCEACGLHIPVRTIKLVVRKWK